MRTLTAPLQRTEISPQRPAAPADVVNDDASEHLRVAIWFPGVERLCAFTAPTETAHRYADLMARRFRGLRVMVDDPDADTLEALPRLPSERMWELTVQ